MIAEALPDFSPEHLEGPPRAAQRKLSGAAEALKRLERIAQERATDTGDNSEASRPPHGEGVPLRRSYQYRVRSETLRS